MSTSRGSIPKLPTRESSMESFIIHAVSKFKIVVIHFIVTGLNYGLDCSPKYKYEETVIQPIYYNYMINYTI
jgi:hypothetical protein